VYGGETKRAAKIVAGEAAWGKTKAGDINITGPVFLFRVATARRLECRRQMARRSMQAAEYPDQRQNRQRNAEKPQQ
jgi:hypothetical protein